jgi:cytidylate kinase
MMSNPNGISIIAISGKSGCGNTTVSRLVSENLGLRFINYTFRAMADERGMKLADILSRAEVDDSWDRLLDSRQVELAREGPCVIGSRLALWLLPEASMKVYLKASHAVRVKRIHEREMGDIETVSRFTAERDVRDHGRYKELYGIDTDDLTPTHLVIDTEKWSAIEVAEIIVHAFKIRGVNHGK